MNQAEVSQTVNNLRTTFSALEASAGHCLTPICMHSLAAKACIQERLNLMLS